MWPFPIQSCGECIVTIPPGDLDLDVWTGLYQVWNWVPVNPPLERRDELIFLPPLPPTLSAVPELPLKTWPLSPGILCAPKAARW